MTPYVAIAMLALLTASSTALAEEHVFRAPEHQHLDGRFAHNQFYFDRGYVVREAPRAGFAIERGPDHFWYDRGVWYRGDGVSWVVVAAPFGAFVPVLPPFYTTVWFHGVPYYYANETYYTWDTGHEQYEVVEPPPGFDAEASTAPPPSNTLFVYPKNGQSPEQMDRDRYDCQRSAAETACLEARGYSVK